MRKTIEYYGKTYTVLDWVEYVATDKDGLICGYASIPQSCGDWWVCDGDDLTFSAIARLDGEVENYRETLRGV